MNEDQSYDAAARERVRELRKKRWERRRAWAQNRISTISMLFLGLVFVLITLFLLVFPRSTVSEIEKRTLAAFPSFSISSYFSGEFTEGVAKHYDDTVPYRDSFKNAGNRLKSLFGFRSSENTFTLINKPLVAEAVGAAPADPQDSSETTPTTPSTTDPTTPADPSATEPTTPEPEPEPEEPPQKDFRAEDAEFNMTNGLLIVMQDGHWKCLGLFGGGSGSAYAEALNTLQGKVGTGVTIYSMPAPLASQFYVPNNASEYSSDQSACFDGVAEKLDSKIVSLNICDELAKHTEENIYCRTDHHWQALGAYYACKCFAETAKVPYADLSEYTKGVNEGYVGTMYAFSEDSRILNDPEDFVYYVPKCDYKAHFYDTSFNYQFSDDLFFEVSTASSYLMFLGSDEYVVKVDGAVKNNRKLLVIKDSYGNAEIPFLTSSFEQVYVADMRYFQCNLPNFIKSMGITDVLFSMCSYSIVGANADNLMNLITQNPDAAIEDGQLAQAQQDANTAKQPQTNTPTER